MKLLGLVGGMSWENTIEYYRRINKSVQKRLGGWNSAKLMLYSVNFAKILEMEEQGKWQDLTKIMLQVCQKLENSGCKGIFICSNTMHKIADTLQKGIDIPIIHVVDALGKSIKTRNIKTIGLLGTKTTMEGGFYIQKLHGKYKVEAKVPNQKDREFINDMIYNELSKAIIKDETKHKLLSIVEGLVERGSKGIVLGCTELPLIIKKDEVSVPLFDTMNIHIAKAVDFMLR